jgi:Protein of unknown function (DUF1592)
MRRAPAAAGRNTRSAAVGERVNGDRPTSTRNCRCFPNFTNELRQAMFEEPIRFVGDVIRNDRPVLDLLYGPVSRGRPVRLPGRTRRSAPTKSAPARDRFSSRRPYQ